MNDTSRYPRELDIRDGRTSLTLMTATDGEAVLAFAQSLPIHDLLFLRRDIRQAKVVAAWLDQIDRGEITSLIAREGDVILGCSAVVVDRHSWSPHVGELRVLVGPAGKERGLGRQLIQESFLLALGLGMDKLTAQMTPDQTAAITVFEEMGFSAEALLKDHVRDAAGTTHDIVTLSHNVSAFAAQMRAYGITDLY